MMVTAPLISGVQVHSMFLEVPLSDFANLPRQLGCSLHRRRGSLVLSGDRGGCALTFDIEAERTLLSHIAIRNDVEGRFVRDVVIPLFIAYAGELEALLEWKPGRQDPPLVIRAGETQHPLYVSGASELSEESLSLIERWEQEAHDAWDTYQRLKQANDAST